MLGHVLEMPVVWLVCRSVWYQPDGLLNVVCGQHSISVCNVSCHADYTLENILEVAAVWLAMQLLARWVVECWCVGITMYAVCLAMQTIHL